MLGPSVIRRLRLSRLIGLAAVGVSLVAAAGCRCDGQTRRIDEAAILKCERGIEQAKNQKTADDAMAVYYRECATLNAEASCRDAWLQAANVPAPKRLSIIVPACSKAYCPLLKDHPYEACAPGFKATDEAVFRAWPPLYGAILAYDAGEESPRLMRGMLTLYANVQQRGAPPASASASAAPSASVGVPDAAPPGVGSAMASASASPTASAQGPGATTVSSVAKPQPGPSASAR